MHDIQQQQQHYKKKMGWFGKRDDGDRRKKNTKIKKKVATHQNISWQASQLIGKKSKNSGGKKNRRWKSFVIIPNLILVCHCFNLIRGIIAVAKRLKPNISIQCVNYTQFMSGWKSTFICIIEPSPTLYVCNIFCIVLEPHASHASAYAIWKPAWTNCW